MNSSQSSNQPSRLDIIDTFVIASIATIIVIRAVLSLLGFPKLGGDNFHIGHMLWGGLALTAALLISLLQRQANRELLALLGGVGFGFFIDEIGKFVTSDNNYFYHGSFLLMYLSLLVIWLICRILVARSEQQLLYLPATWPQRRYERALVVIWVLSQLAAIPLLTYSIWTTSLWVLLQLACIIVYLLTLLLGVWYIVNDASQRAASTIRLATFVAIITVLPLLYYLNPGFALGNTLCAVLVMVGLSEVSLRQIIRRW